MSEVAERPQDFKDEAFKGKHTITIEIGEAYNPGTGKDEPASRIGINDAPFSLEVVEEALKTLGTWVGEIFVRSCEKAVQDPKSGVYGQSAEEIIQTRALVFWSKHGSIYAHAFADEVNALYPKLHLLNSEAIANAIDVATRK